MRSDLPTSPLKIDELKSNITFGQLQKMSHTEVSNWVDKMRLEILNLWDNGVLPYQGIEKKQIIDNFRKLKDFKGGVRFIKDDIQSDFVGFIKNFSKMANSINQFFPALWKSKKNGKSIYDYLTNENLIKEFKYTIIQNVRFDKKNIYTKYIISKGENDNQQFIEWVKSRSDDIRFWIENWNFNSMNEELNRLRLSSVEVKKLRDKGLINRINENNHDGFNDIIDVPSFYTVRYYDKTLKLFPKLFQVLWMGLNQISTQFPVFTARWIYENYLPIKDNQSLYKVYDASAGWGGRMLGALCSKLPIHYIGTYINPKNKGCFESLGEFYNENADGKNTYEIYYRGSEEIHDEEDFQRHFNDIDLVFSTLNYFERKLILDNDAQTLLKIPKYKDWLEGFIKPTLVKSFNVLKPYRYCLINITDTSIGEKFSSQIEEDTIRSATEIGFKYKGKIGITMMKISERKSTGMKNYWTDTNSNLFWKVKPILIFLKN